MGKRNRPVPALRILAGGSSRKAAIDVRAGRLTLMTSVQLVDEIRGALAAAGDPGKAAREQAYMKSTLPFHGVRLPEVRRITKRLLKEHPLTGRDQWERAIRELWDEVTHREHWYAALEIAGHRDARGWQDLDALALYRQLAVTGAWWDVVDEIASPLVEEVVAADPRGRETVWAWATEDDLWLRRVSVICQLQRKTTTDLELLTHAIDSNLEGSQYGSEFFIRKAIGWALRQYARIDAGWVRDFVTTRGSQLSGLSRREALKHLR